MLWAEFNWKALLKKFKLGNYVSNLELNEFDDCELWIELSMEDLQEVGIASKGALLKWNKMITFMSQRGTFQSPWIALTGRDTK